MKHRDKNKVTIIGAGFVGATTAYSLMHQNVAEEIAIIDVNEKLLTAQVADLKHALPVLGYAEVKAGTYDDIKDSTVVVFACGFNQHPGETRLDLLKKNCCLVEEIVPKIFAANPNAILVMVTNPVDVLTYQAITLFPKKKNQIFGTGTILDTLRLRLLVGEALSVDPQSVHAYIAGEHGDSEFPLWSSATIGGQKLLTFNEFQEEKFEAIFEEVKNSAAAIIEGKQATYYGIGAGAAHLVNSIILNKKTVLPVSHLMEGDYGLRDVCISMPAVVGEAGILQKLDLQITTEESAKLKQSAEILKQAFASIKK